MTDKQTWLKDEYKQIKEEEEARLKELGMNELLHLEKGDNRITIDLEQGPKEVDTKYGLRRVLMLKHPEGKDLMLTPWIYKQLVSFIVEHGDNPNVVIIKTGEGKDTRYEFKEWGGQK